MVLPLCRDGLQLLATVSNWYYTGENPNVSGQP